MLSFCRYFDDDIHEYTYHPGPLKSYGNAARSIMGALLKAGSFYGGISTLAGGGLRRGQVIVTMAGAAKDDLNISGYIEQAMEYYDDAQRYPVEGYYLDNSQLNILGKIAASDVRHRQPEQPKGK